MTRQHNIRLPSDLDLGPHPSARVQAALKVINGSGLLPIVQEFEALIVAQSHARKTGRPRKTTAP